MFSVDTNHKVKYAKLDPLTFTSCLRKDNLMKGCISCFLFILEFYLFSLIIFVISGSNNIKVEEIGTLPIQTAFQNCYSKDFVDLFYFYF